jgi:hypothetical protein
VISFLAGIGRYLVCILSEGETRLLIWVDGGRDGPETWLPGGENKYFFSNPLNYFEAP